ncbi:FHA domain-containing protein [Nocardia sp. NPDC051030]|uniref:FHA domain-containing protein n=1 Tax=Nocardia sp. NPDC051030 TaxID=3155162 RepID=UPI00342F26D6
MMPTCPEGHPSVSTDYCDTCGSPMGSESHAATINFTQCPACGAPVAGRFCEDCGHDTLLPAPPPPPPPPPDPHGTEGGEALAVWVATITADRAHYSRMLAQKGPDAQRLEFPEYYPNRRITLRGTDILIGKHSDSQGVHPDIDLGMAPVDIAVSRTHAIIHIDGTAVTVTDLGSTNGTCLNGNPDPIRAKVAVPLHNGDRIHVGGWTTITLTSEPDAGPP